MTLQAMPATGAARLDLAGDWEGARCPAGAPADPTDLSKHEWFCVHVPGSLPGQVPDFVSADADAMVAADSEVWWIRRTFTLDRDLAEPVLRWDRLATYGTIFIDRRPVAASTNAHRRYEQQLPPLTAGEHEITIHIAALHDVPVPKRPRPRWHSSLIPDRSLRWRRTPYLGRIPTWQGALPQVGLIGSITLDPAPRARLTDLRCRLEGTDGRLTFVVSPARAAADLVVTLDGHPVRARLADESGVALSDTARLVFRVPEARVWWPHTHGPSPSYRLEVSDSHGVLLSRRVGFSSIRTNTAEGRFSLVVNDVPVFARGACWVPVDAVSWREDAATIRSDLAHLATAGMNIVRVTGTNAYEGEAFWDACVEMGFLVWQEVMLATFDPPAEADWLAEVRTEFIDQLGRLQGRPNVAVVCGGTETQQQPCLLGLGPEALDMPVLDRVLPEVVTRVLPGVAHVASSPSSPPGHFPVSIEKGVSHYFGVGAYLRSIEDARNARVSFASECLAFAIPPEPETLRRRYGGTPDLDSPEWTAGIMRDRNVDWDFQDVTERYVHDLYGVRRGEVSTDEWLQLCREAVTLAMTRAMAYWRSSDTPTGGAIILAHRDLRPGPGWGLLDSDGCPKAPLLALRDVLAPVAILPLDRGLEGLALDIRNDNPETVTGTLSVEVHTAGNPWSVPSISAATEVTIPARGGILVEVEHLLGSFRDLGWTWRLGESPCERIGAKFNYRLNDAGPPFPRLRHAQPPSMGQQGGVAGQHNSVRGRRAGRRASLTPRPSAPNRLSPEDSSESSTIAGLSAVALTTPLPRGTPRPHAT